MCASKDAKHLRKMEKAEGKEMRKEAKEIRREERKERKEIRREEKRERKDMRREWIGSKQGGGVMDAEPSRRHSAFFVRYQWALCFVQSKHAGPGLLLFCTGSLGMEHADESADEAACSGVPHRTAVRHQIPGISSLLPTVNSIIPSYSTPPLDPMPWTMILRHVSGGSSVQSSEHQEFKPVHSHFQKQNIPKPNHPNTQRTCYPPPLPPATAPDGHGQTTPAASSPRFYLPAEVSNLTATFSSMPVAFTTAMQTSSARPK
ncbi:hypothetical protein BDK51DRAFT_48402 [Blyttiomyces helicus]|uniref:Uncharacterized protein n=1 Tax=Blyttiomyces helicus TaxID=388810 RepID=A0A4P9VTN9_9FUNG|nr:hypothetical protein BDK51DRAFT_48402 [Blyttiomyces helicus]|eukprot:RKO82899.1 hypothetical protein BDK51DRAFT_48402 [Blyttiomyces helicus]